MNVFDIIGPVMIGPSSSHTAGACRIGRVVNKICDRVLPKKVIITLSGSFARTYKGHGTDRALLAGIMGYHSWDEQVRDGLTLALEKGIDYTFVKKDLPGCHPNTARIEYFMEDGTSGIVQGASIGGGNIRIDDINGMKVDFAADMNTILVLHEDVPGVIADVTALMRTLYSEVNISGFKLARRERGGEALMTIEIDGLPPEGMIENLRRVQHVANAILVRKV